MRATTRLRLRQQTAGGLNSCTREVEPDVSSPGDVVDGVRCSECGADVVAVRIPPVAAESAQGCEEHERWPHGIAEPDPLADPGEREVRPGIAACRER